MHSYLMDQYSCLFINEIYELIFNFQWDRVEQPCNKQLDVIFFNKKRMNGNKMYKNSRFPFLSHFSAYVVSFLASLIRCWYV